MPTVTIHLDGKYDCAYDLLLSMLHESWHEEEYLEADVDFELLSNGTSAKVWLDRRFLDLGGTVLSILEGDHEHLIYLRVLNSGEIKPEEIK